MSRESERKAAAEGTEAQLSDQVRAQLRAAAESLAQQTGGDVQLAEQAIVASALELTKGATVFQFTPVLATRRARQRLREAPQPGMTTSPEDDGRGRGGDPP